MPPFDKFDTSRYQQMQSPVPAAKGADPGAMNISPPSTTMASVHALFSDEIAEVRFAVQRLQFILDRVRGEPAPTDVTNAGPSVAHPPGLIGAFSRLHDGMRDLRQDLHAALSELEQHL